MQAAAPIGLQEPGAHAVQDPRVDCPVSPLVLVPAGQGVWEVDVQYAPAGHTVHACEPVLSAVEVVDVGEE